MNVTNTESTLSVESVRARGHKLFFESVPGMQPTVAVGYRLVALVSEKHHVEARDVSNPSDYAALVAQSGQVGAYFTIEGLYSVPDPSQEGSN